MKFFTLEIFCVFVAVTSAIPGNRRHTHQRVEINNSKPKYEYKYGIRDLDTADIKQQWEYRDGDQVKGGYSFKEADGFIRVVEYCVNGESGFKAVVRRFDPSKYSDTKGHSHHEHIAFKGNHVQHDANARAISYVNILHQQ